MQIFWLKVYVFFRKYYYSINYFENTCVCKIIFLFYRKNCYLKKSSLFETIIRTFSFPTYLFFLFFFIFTALDKIKLRPYFLPTPALYIFLSFYRGTDFTPRKLLLRMSTNADHHTLDGCFTFLTFRFMFLAVESHVRARSLSLFSLAAVAFVRHSHCFRTRLICCPVRLQLSFTTESRL